MISKSKFERCLIEQCAPTLAGIKLGSLFNCAGAITAGEDVVGAALMWDEILRAKGINIRLMTSAKNSTILAYIYRPHMLAQAISDSEIKGFLKNYGYDTTSGVEACLNRLAERLEIECEFPHEIGVFLGYPLPDVIGFIENRGDNYRLSGPWKVYHDPLRAKALFEQYNACRQHYSMMYEDGRSIASLTV
ncbi:MAG: DUF3793 family protein [Clostridiales bacterium]|nr:DUF3793 family protein [Clostridiales bacterium]